MGSARIGKPSAVFAASTASKVFSLACEDRQRRSVVECARLVSATINQYIKDDKDN